LELIKGTKIRPKYFCAGKWDMKELIGISTSKKRMRKAAVQLPRLSVFKTSCVEQIDE